MRGRQFDRNFALLPCYLQQLMAPYRNWEGPGCASIELLSGRQGEPVARVEAGGNAVLANSLEDPLSEAAAWASRLEYDGIRVAFVYGCGFGYPLLAYVQSKKPYTELFVFEQNPALFAAMLHQFDLAGLLEDETIHFAVGGFDEMKQQLALIMGGELLIRSAKLMVAFTSLAHRQFKAEYLQLHEWLMSVFSQLLLGIGNCPSDALMGLHNIVDNVPAILQGASAEQLRDRYAGKPAFVIANGPSLDRNIAALHQARGKALLLAAESALLPCIKRGIYPDAVCATERTPNVYDIHFAEGGLPQEVALIALALVDPRIPPVFGHRWVPIFRGMEQSADWVEQALGLPPSLFKGGTSSAHLAFEFALWAGADPIIFIGQDLAFGAGRATHSKLSAYSDAVLAGQVRALQAEPVIEVPGIDGRPVATTRLWKQFKEWLEHYIALYPGRTFIDATEGGAYIAGTRPMPAEEAIAAYCTERLEIPLHEAIAAGAGKSNADDLHRVRERMQAGIAPMLEKLGQLDIAAQQHLDQCRLILLACRLHRAFPEAKLPRFVHRMLEEVHRAHLAYVGEGWLLSFLQPVVYGYQKQIMELGELSSIDDLQHAIQVYEAMFGKLLQMGRLLRRYFAAMGQHMQQ